MKSPIQFLPIIVATLSLVTTTAFAEALVKLECWGDCANTTTTQVCSTYAAHSKAVTVSCDQISSQAYGTSVPCGGGTCVEINVVNQEPMDQFCADGGDNDAVVTCRQGSASPVTSVGAVKADCFGNCSNVRLSDICSMYYPGARAVSVSCDDTAPLSSSPGGHYGCGYGGDTCTVWGAVADSDPLGAYCLDGPGMDAIVFCK